MNRPFGAAVVSFVLIAAAGCDTSTPGQSGSPVAAEPAKQAAVQPDGRKPDQVVRVFFEGLKSGDESKIDQSLTAKARANDLINPEPRNATFEVGEVRYVNEAIAHVPSVWTFFDEKGQRIGTDEAIWALRLEPEGWRIAGTLMRIPDLNQMVALDFENKEEYEATKRRVEAELERASSSQETEVAARPGEHSMSEPARKNNSSLPTNGDLDRPPSRTR